VAGGHGGDDDEALEDAMQRCVELAGDLGPQRFLVITDAAPHLPQECPYRLDYAREVRALLDGGSTVWIADDWCGPDARARLDIGTAEGFRMGALKILADALTT
jgi:hypothetical protein